MTRRAPYTPHPAFVAPARDYADLWRTALGLLLIETAWGLTMVMLSFDPATAYPLLTTLSHHLTFLAMTLTTFWVVRRLQHRSSASLFGPAERLLPDLIRSASAVSLLFAALYLTPPWGWEGINLARAPVKWALLLPVSILAVLIQTSAEEIVFRGFLQQSLGARFKSPLIWMGLPSVLFGLAHYDPTMPLPITVEHMIWATVFGIAAADLTARTGGLGAAIGLHLATNFLAIVIFSPPGPLSGFALFSFPDIPADAEANPIGLLIDLLFLWMSWMACRIAVRA